MFRQFAVVICWSTACWFLASATPEQGKFSLVFNATQQYQGIVKNVFGNTAITIRIRCESDDLNAMVKVGWVLRESPCWNEYAYLDDGNWPYYYANPQDNLGLANISINYIKQEEVSKPCKGAISLDQIPSEVTTESPGSKSSLSVLTKGKVDPQYIVPHSGDYLLILKIEGSKFRANADVELLSPRGYLSLTDWPLLPFYGTMCAMYVLMGITWLILCSRHWRDLLRIQFWIGGVIFLGMLEKAMFLAEYENINSTGEATKGLIFAAEVVSCAKRTLARMLVIIMSLGFGIVKPRLGPTLHRVVVIGFLYFAVAVAEAHLRINAPKNDLSSDIMMASIPLAVIDSSICWWIFSSLLATIRTLRLRRNLVKLSLYRHFTNTLVFSVIASVFFMLWSIKYHKMEDCLIDWRDLWTDEAFWHLLFSVILCTIMFLWRPSQNNQRYAFTPLLDNEEDEMSETDDEDPFYKDKVSLRNVGQRSRQNSPGRRKDDSEDTLRWIEENIPESDMPLPVLDSDEEIETTKFELSKMQ